MATKFDLGELTSRIVRSQIGERELNLSLDSGTSDDQGNIVSWVIDIGKRLIGFILILVSKIKLTVTQVFGWFVNFKNFIWNFNWNATDQQLEESINAKLDTLAGSFGAFLGNTLGYVVCGILPSAVMIKFNESLGSYLLKEVGDELAEEFVQNLGVLINQVLNISAQVFFTRAYKTARKLIKQNADFITKLFGGNDLVRQAINAWGEPGQKPWSFALSHEEKLEAISNSRERNFKEEFAEEFDEACIEAGYIIANGIDTWLAQDALNKKINPVLGKERFVEITPNRNIPEEKIILGGNEALLRQEIITQLGVYQQLGDRDLGVIYGTENNQPVRSEKPEVVLRFYERKEDRVIGTGANGKPVSDPNPLTMQISFRLMNKDESNFVDKSYATQLAQLIYQKFAQPPFRIQKGANLYTYHDWSKGYSLNLWVSNEGEARRVIGQVLEIQGHNFDNEKLRVGSVPVGGRKLKDRKTVLGKPEEIVLPGGKSGIVTFSHAFLNIGNGSQPVNLVDLTGRKRDVIYKP